MSFEIIKLTIMQLLSFHELRFNFTNSWRIDSSQALDDSILPFFLQAEKNQLMQHNDNNHFSTKFNNLASEWWDKKTTYYMNHPHEKSITKMFPMRALTAFRQPLFSVLELFSGKIGSLSICTFDLQGAMISSICKVPRFLRFARCHDFFIFEFPEFPWLFLLFPDSEIRFELPMLIDFRIPWHSNKFLPWFFPH